ncbi:ArsR family transcriptional regulator [archaeon]|nr:MAG: ArsR family transcriptional regulator [archaeon]
MAQKERIMPKLFLHVKPIRILTVLRDGPKYATAISKETDCTYSHTVKLLDVFRDFGLVDFEKKGRIKIIKLTDTGEDLARSVSSIVLKLGRLKEKVGG